VSGVVPGSPAALSGSLSQLSQLLLPLLCPHTHTRCTALLDIPPQAKKSKKKILPEEESKISFFEKNHARSCGADRGSGVVS
jgi:hypothetical protein